MVLQKQLNFLYEEKRALGKIVKDYDPEYNVESKSVWEHTDVLMYTNNNMIYDGKYMIVIVGK